MKYHVVLLFCLLFCRFTFAQAILGKVIDERNGRSVDRVSIYYESTSIGTFSDEQGSFSIRSLPDNSVPLVISCVGFETQVISPPFPAVMEVRLKPRSTQLRPVSIGFDGMAEKKKLDWFKREFLGADQRGCLIVNEKDLFLDYDRNSRRLEVSADQPLTITNPYLGYTLTYGLGYFGATQLPPGVAYQGSQYFKDLEVKTGKATEEVLNRREKAYYGSKMHFIRSLWSRRLVDEGFKVWGAAGVLSDLDLLQVVDGKKYMVVRSPLRVTYRSAKTWIYPFSEKDYLIEIDSKGFFDPSKVTWSGAMVVDRVAMLLPFDYQPRKKR